jgi:hypothetical protein
MKDMKEQHAKKRTKAEDDLLLALACGSTVEAAAGKAEMSIRTAYRRLEDPEFSLSVRSMRQQILQRTCGMFTAASGEAVKTLLQLLNANQPSAARLGASKAILEIGCKFRDHEEFEERLRRLEDRFAEGDHVLT